MTLGGSYNDTEIQDKNLFVQSCGNARTTRRSGCTVTDPVGPFTGTAYIDGNPLPRAPKWQANFTLKYSIPVGQRRVLRLHRLGLPHQLQLLPVRSEGVQGQGTARRRLARRLQMGQATKLSAYGRNITNQVQSLGAIDFDNLTGIVNEPRTYGVQFKVNF